MVVLSPRLSPLLGTVYLFWLTQQGTVTVIAHDGKKLLARPNLRGSTVAVLASIGVFSRCIPDIGARPPERFWDMAGSQSQQCW